MNYLVIEKSGQRIVSADDLRDVIDNGKGEIKIYRLCGMNDPKRLFFLWFGNMWSLVDGYGNIETGV